MHRIFLDRRRVICANRLRRRIAKLNVALEETELRLSEVSTSGVDDGVSSAYRSVQGLEESESYDLKLSLLREIVDANLELRRLISETGLAQAN